MRQDGKFIVNGDVPEGQGSVTELLSECFDIAYEMRLEAEAQAEDSADEKDTDSGVQLDERSEDKDAMKMKMEALGESVAAVTIETT